MLASSHNITFTFNSWLTSGLYPKDNYLLPGGDWLLIIHLPPSPHHLCYLRWSHLLLHRGVHYQVGISSTSYHSSFQFLFFTSVWIVSWLHFLVENWYTYMLHLNSCSSYCFSARPATPSIPWSPFKFMLMTYFTSCHPPLWQSSTWQFTNTTFSLSTPLLINL